VYILRFDKWLFKSYFASIYLVGILSNLQPFRPLEPGVQSPYILIVYNCRHKTDKSTLTLCGVQRTFNKAYLHLSTSKSVHKQSHLFWDSRQPDIEIQNNFKHYVKKRHKINLHRDATMLSTYGITYLCKMKV
jgi:hypothetical protein